ncbi:MAG TPA: LLM class flavin-dependent oxidoreductase [Chloroflexi bacterium]|nr:LLM class flavin-dependent oxidoreductase [Chloroflexota bacterium]
MARPLKIGFILPQIEGRREGTTPGWTDILAAAQVAEDIGFDSLWLVDHLLYQFGPDDPPRGIWECWTLLSALAATTTRAELGTLVTCTGFRNPALLAKMADTVDEISGGRVILGLGAGYYEHEYASFGYPYDHRVSRFEEALHIIAPLLRDGRATFRGQYSFAEDCELRPRGPRPKGLPIMIGTGGERMLRLTAEHADAWNGWLVRGQNHPDAIPPLRERIDAACRQIGRDPATLTRTATVMVDPRPSAVPSRTGPLAGTPEEIADAFRSFAREGISHIQIASRVTNAEGIEQFRPILAALDRD